MKEGCVKVIRVAVSLVWVGILGGNVAQAEPAQARIDVMGINGTACFSKDGMDYYPLHAGDFVGPGFLIKTASISRVDLFLPDSGTVLRVQPDSVLQFARLNKSPAGELTVSDTSLKLLKGSVVGSQHKLSAPSHFDITTSQNTATIVGTEYVVNANGAVSVLDGTVRLNYKLPGNQIPAKVSVPAGYSFDLATGNVARTATANFPSYNHDIQAVRDNMSKFGNGGGDSDHGENPDCEVSPHKGHHHHHDHDHDGDDHHGQDHGHDHDYCDGDGHGNGPGNHGSKGDDH